MSKTFSTRRVVRPWPTLSPPHRFIQEVNTAAVTIQRWYRRHAQQRRAAAAALGRLLASKREVSPVTRTLVTPVSPRGLLSSSSTNLSCRRRGGFGFTSNQPLACGDPGGPRPRRDVLAAQGTAWGWLRGGQRRRLRPPAPSAASGQTLGCSSTNPAEFLLSWTRWWPGEGCPVSL